MKAEEKEVSKGLETYIVSGIAADRLPQLDVLCSQSLNLSSDINDTGSGRASAHINANEVLLLADHHFASLASWWMEECGVYVHMYMCVVEVLVSGVGLVEFEKQQWLGATHSSVVGKAISTLCRG